MPASTTRGSKWRRGKPPRYTSSSSGAPGTGTASRFQTMCFARRSTMVWLGLSSASSMRIDCSWALPENGWNFCRTTTVLCFGLDANMNASKESSSPNSSTASTARRSTSALASRNERSRAAMSLGRSRRRTAFSRARVVFALCRAVSRQYRCSCSGTTFPSPRPAAGVATTLRNRFRARSRARSRGRASSASGSKEYTSSSASSHRRGELLDGLAPMCGR